MNVLNLAGGIGPNTAEQTIRRLDAYFPECSITYGLFESWNPEFERLAAAHDIETVFFGPSTTNRFDSISLLPGRGYPKAVEHALRHRGDFDLVHVYGGPLFHGPIGAVYAALCGVPLITRFNGYVPLPDTPLKRTAVRTTIDRLLQSTRVVFNSHAQMLDTLSTYNVERGDHMEVIPPGIEQRWFEPVEETADQANTLGIDPDTAVIGSVMTPRPVKRLDRAFDVLSLIAEEREVAYVIIGQSDRVEHYKKLAAEKGVADKVYWTGHIGHEELANWYSLFDVTILTSEWESFGMSISESYLCGTPCVTFDVGGMSDQIVDGETGYLVDPYDVDEFAAAVERLLSDEERANTFAAEGMKYVSQRFTLETVSNQYREMVGDIT